MKPRVRVEDLNKAFVLHNQNGAVIPIFDGVEFAVSGGECLVLAGPSGTGKSTLLRLVYGNYKCSQGRILVCHDDGWLDMASASPQAVLDVRRRTMGYVSQFLRVIPRVPALQVVSEPLRAQGAGTEEAATRARELLEMLRIPERLWDLSPLTFSGGEQQRINIARGFAADYPILLLDEPTASLDAQNRRTVIDLIEVAKNRGVAILGIFHDPEVREAVMTTSLDVAAFGIAA